MYSECVVARVCGSNIKIMSVDIYNFNGVAYYLFCIDTPTLALVEQKYQQQSSGSSSTTSIIFTTTETFDHDTHYHIVLCLEYLNRLNSTCGVISVHERFVRSFGNGIERSIHITPLCPEQINMFPSRYLRINNDVSFKLDYLFENELPGLLSHRMDTKYIPVYLRSLRTSLVENDDNVNAWLQKHNVPYDIGADPCDAVVNAIKKLSNTTIAAITHVIMSNRLSSLVPPNTILFGEMNKVQQMALSIKRNNEELDVSGGGVEVDVDEMDVTITAHSLHCDDDDDEDDDGNDDDDGVVVAAAAAADDVDDDDNDDNNNEGSATTNNNHDGHTPPLLQGQIVSLSDLQLDSMGRPQLAFQHNVHIYVHCSKYILTAARLTVQQLEYLLQKNIVTAFRIVGNRTNTTKKDCLEQDVELVIDVNVYAEFRSTKISKKFFDCSVISDNFTFSPAQSIVFGKLNYSAIGVMQSGCPIFHELVSFSNEQNAIKCKQIEMYAIVCPHILHLLCKQYRISFIIHRTLQRGDKYFTFYQTTIYLDRCHIYEILGQIYPYHSKTDCCHQYYKLCNESLYDDHLVGDHMTTMFDAVWMQVPCMYIYYHTSFDFFLRVISAFLSLSDCAQSTMCNMFGVDPYDPCVRAHIAKTTLFQTTIYNYSMFKYIKAVQNPAVATKKNGFFFASLYMNIVKIMDRDVISPLLEIELDKNLPREHINAAQRLKMRSISVRFVEFSGVADGPMLPAVSIRSCEQMRKNSTAVSTVPPDSPTEWGTDIVNLSMFLNNVRLGGQESGQTKLNL